MHITLITPSLNYGRFLGECLESVAAQMDDFKERRNPSADTQEEQTERTRSLEIDHSVIDGGSRMTAWPWRRGFIFSTFRRLVPI